MTNKNITQNIIDEYAGIDENLNGNVWEKIENALNTNNSVSTQKTKKQSMPMKKFVLIAAAVMLSLTMLVSAVTVIYNIYNDMYMLPGMGLFDGFNENVRAMPKVLEFGDTTIEMAMTYDKDGVNTFYMTIYGEGGGYTDKRPEKRDYENLEIIFQDGTSVLLESRPNSSGNRSEGRDGTPSGYYFMYDYEYENFPDECEFTLKNNKGTSTEVKLAPIEARTMKITDNGIKRVKIIPAAEGSRIFSHNIEIIEPSVTENIATYMWYDINLVSWDDRPNYGIFYKDGKVLTKCTAGGMGIAAPIFAVDENADYKYHVWGEISFDYDFIEGEIDKIIIKELGANLLFDDYGFDYDLTKVILPLPEKGERFDYETPLEIAKIGEFIFSVDAIERERNNLLVYTSSGRCINYSGSEDISNINFSFAGLGFTGGNSEEVNIYKYIHTIKIPENHSGDTFETAINMIQYTIRGYWEIDFE